MYLIQHYFEHKKESRTPTESIKAITLVFLTRTQTKALPIIISHHHRLENWEKITRRARMRVGVGCGAAHEPEKVGWKKENLWSAPFGCLTLRRPIHARSRFGFPLRSPRRAQKEKHYQLLYNFFLTRERGAEWEWHLILSTGMWIVALACVVVIDGKLGKRKSSSSNFEINKFCLFAASPLIPTRLLPPISILILQCGRRKKNLGKYQVSSIN